MLTLRLLQTLPLACLAAAGPFVATSAAQARPEAAVEFAAGALIFPDDGVVREGLTGGQVRLYVTPRLSVGPEVAFIQGRRHSHFMLTGNVTFDWLSPSRGQARLVTPYLVAGAGLFQTREQLFTGPYTSRDGAFTAGVGVRAHPGRRVIVGAEARIGWEMHLRLNGLVGVRLGA